MTTMRWDDVKRQAKQHVSPPATRYRLRWVPATGVRRVRQRARAP
ncbi:hypothetical protein [Protofrankia coriariae]|nr:hypothetical protein [Protofrankia coriariae]